jgi:hypothetical protein
MPSSSDDLHHAMLPVETSFAALLKKDKECMVLALLLKSRGCVWIRCFVILSKATQKKGSFKSRIHVQKDDLKVTNAMLPFTVGVKLLHT